MKADKRMPLRRFVLIGLAAAAVVWGAAWVALRRMQPARPAVSAECALVEDAGMELAGSRRRLEDLANGRTPAGRAADAAGRAERAWTRARYPSGDALVLGVRQALYDEQLFYAARRDGMPDAETGARLARFMESLGAAQRMVEMGRKRWTCR